MKHHIKFLTASLLFITLTSGVYRHDKPLEEYMAYATQPQFDCVGHMYRQIDGSWHASGSCVLIDSIHIITAAHCMVDYLKKDTIVYMNGLKINTWISQGKIALPPTDFWILVNNQYVKPKRILLYPSYLGHKDADIDDIALIELEQPVKGAQNIILNSTPDELGDTVMIVGYGAVAKGLTTEYSQTYSVKMAGQNIIDSIGRSEQNGLRTMLFCDFDMPFGKDKQDCNKMGADVALPLEFGIQGGDSGGGLFRMKNNNLQLIGITSYSDGAMPKNFKKYGYYGEICGWTRIAAFHSWLKANL